MNFKKILIITVAAITGQQSFAQSTIAGNALSGTEFLGSSNNVNVDFKANNVQYMRLTPGGYLGIGTTSPVTALTIQTAATNNGIRIIQTGTTASTLGLFNSSAGAHNYALFSTGIGNGQGAGNFSIYDYTTATDRLFIQGSTGNIGIGVGALPTSKLHVYSNYPTLSSTDALGFFDANRTANGTAIAVKGIATSRAGATGAFSTGLYGIGQADPSIAAISTGETYGVYGMGRDSHTNFGGYFTAIASGTSNVAVGVFSICDGSNGASAWAGYFSGNTFCSGLYQSSDMKLKNNIKPLNNAIDKIKLLKPSTYTYKTNEFKSMNLPEGQQMGLIAQDLEKVFPELIKEVSGFEQKDENGKAVSIPNFKSVNYIGLIPVLISAIQEQQQKIESQEAAIEQLIKQQNSNVLNSADPYSVVKLYQNEPNPFNQETVIKYYLPEQISKAYIAIYDLSGKQLTTIPLTEKGASSVTVNSNKLSTGIYIYSIIADNKLIESKRMVLTE